MIEFICIFYYIFNVLFMMGYVDDTNEPIRLKIVLYIVLFIISPIMFPINIGYYIRENS